ncbi:MAG: Chromosomal replication initiator protein DnaA [Verrucomicrobiota bacterium]|jgi:chromosomal replication initiator protein
MSNDNVNNFTVNPQEAPTQPPAAEAVWHAAQEVLKGLLNADLYRLWFAPLTAVSIDQNCLTLEVANDFSELWIKDNYLNLIQDVLKSSSGRTLKVVFCVAKNTTKNHSAKPDRPTPRPKNPQDQPNGISPAVGDLTFNPKNTFENFVVGSNNSFAHAAALAVAHTPGQSYNPLFVYGGVGLGKTHLLHAIGLQVVSQRKGARVAYISSERFTNDYIDAIQNNQLAKFRRRYRQTDVLLIDDVQFLAGKERIQEEFFHTFNALHEARKQIVMTCDRPPNEIQNLEQRLVSRFEWGLTTDLQPPDVETRLAILRKKENALGVQLPSDIMNFLASRIRTNVRRLEGALIRVASFASLTGKPLTQEVVEELLREILHEEGRYSITIELIQKRVADHFDIRLADMTSKRRPEHIAFPRQIAMFLARHMTDTSLSGIGEAFGGRDHGTVLHACRLVKDRMEVDTNVRQAVNYLEKVLYR